MGQTGKLIVAFTNVAMASFIVQSHENAYLRTRDAIMITIVGTIKMNKVAQKNATGYTQTGMTVVGVTWYTWTAIGHGVVKMGKF